MMQNLKTNSIRSSGSTADSVKTQQEDHSLTKTQQDITSHASQQKNQQRLPERVLDRLFVNFRGLYSRISYDLLTAEDQMGVRATWFECLSGVNVLQIDTALKKIKRGDTEFSGRVPKPAEFRRLCISEAEQRTGSVEKTNLILKNFAHQCEASKNCDKSVAKKYMKIIKRLLADSEYAKEYAKANPVEGYRFCEKKQGWVKIGG